MSQRPAHPPGPRIDVRSEFAACVSKMGGTVIDDVLHGVHEKPTNADFMFAADGVIAELKCLEEDWTKDLNSHASACADEWMRRGKLSGRTGGMMELSDPDVPPMLVREIVEPFRKRVKQNLIVKANKQIKQTRKDMGTLESKGLLIVVNDGNLALAPDMMAHLLMPILNSGHFSSINTVIYASVNLPVTIRAPFGNAQFWMPWSIKGKESVSQEFLHKLGDAWMAHLSVVTGDPVFELATTASIDTMRFVNPTA